MKTDASTTEQHNQIRNKGLVHRGIGPVLLADVRVETLVNEFTVTVFGQNAVTSVHG